MSDGAIDEHAAALARLAAVGRELGSLVRKPTAFVAGTYPDSVRDELAARVGTVSSDLAQERTSTARAHTAEKSRVAAAQKAARQEAERIAREKAAREARGKEAKAREEAARAAEAREEVRRTAEARAERRAERQRETADRSSYTGSHADTTREADRSGPASGGGADTYTGCRAYGPGGRRLTTRGVATPRSPAEELPGSTEGSPGTEAIRARLR